MGKEARLRLNVRRILDTKASISGKIYRKDLGDTLILAGMG